MNRDIDLSGLRRGSESGRDSAPDNSRTLVAPPRRVVSRYVVPGVLLCAFVSVIVYAARGALEPATTVRVVQPSAASSQTVSAAGPAFQAPGWIEPDPFPVTVSALTPGIVERVLALEGQHVDAGTTIAELVHDDAILAVRGAEAAVAQRRAQSVAARTNWDEPFALDEALRSTEAELARLAAERVQAERQYEISSSEAALDRTLSSDGAVGKFPARVSKLKADAAGKLISMIDARVEATSAVLKAAQDRRRLRIDDREKVDVARAELDSALATLDEPRLRLRRTWIEAPTSGVIMRLHVGPGSMLSQEIMGGMKVASMYDPLHIQARAEVALADAARVREGLEATILSEALPGRSFRGVITRIVHEADIQRNTLPVKVAIQDPHPALKPEMIVRLQFSAPTDEPTSTPIRQTQVLIVPVDAVTASGPGKGTMWVAGPDGRAHKRDISLGGTQPNGREVVEGLWPTDKIILPGPDPLTEGRRISYSEVN
jgi:HlyD family secretion protein